MGRVANDEGSSLGGRDCHSTLEPFGAVNSVDTSTDNARLSRGPAPGVHTDTTTLHTGQELTPPSCLPWTTATSTKGESAAVKNRITLPEVSAEEKASSDTCRLVGDGEARSAGRLYTFPGFIVDPSRVPHTR